MNCHTVRALYELFGRDPLQFDADEQAALDRHLDACPACREWRQTERQTDAALVTAMKSVTTPVGLERRIRDRLSAARPPWPWRRIAAGTLTALVVVLAVGVWAWWPKTVDVQGELSRVDDAFSPSREAVERHFGGLGYPIQAPSDLQYGYLRTFDLASFQGRRVPRLALSGPSGGQLNVFVLSTSSFALPSELDGEARQQGDRHVLARRAGDFIYVYEWTGNALKDVSNSSN
jgi:hypothetical protein